MPVSTGRYFNFSVLGRDEKSLRMSNKLFSLSMPFIGICMQSCSQCAEMIFLIKCKLVIAAFCLKQLGKVKHPTEKYCEFKTRTCCLLQAVPSKFSIYCSTFSD